MSAPQAVTARQVAAAESRIVELSKKIDFYLTEYTVELLANKMRNEDFVIPSYQREDTWDSRRKSRFIESLLMGLPIPFLFFWERPTTGKLEIVDGSQRLRSIEQYVLGGMVLHDLESIPDLNGTKFIDLPESRQRKIKNRSVRGIVLNEHADNQARFEIFDRINTSSMIANNAEVRRGALVGPFQDLVIELAADPVFQGLAPMPDKTVKLREREELVTRFFAYGDGLDGYRDRPAEFLHQYTKRMNEVFRAKPNEQAQYRKRFTDTMAFVEKTFPYGFRRSSKGKATPRARFEAIAIGTYWALKKKPTLVVAKREVAALLRSEEFQDVIGSDGANVVARLKGRIGFVRDRLLGV